MAISVANPPVGGGGERTHVASAHRPRAVVWSAVLGLVGLAVAVVLIVSSSSSSPAPRATVGHGQPHPPSMGPRRDAGDVCASGSVLRYNAVDCEVPDTEATHLCDAGLKPGHCGFVETASDVSGPVVDHVVARFGRRLVISGDSMARQTLLGLVAAIRAGSLNFGAHAHVRPAAEHYFHCDAVYTVVGRRRPHGGTNATSAPPVLLSDRLSVDRAGHCADGSNAEHSVDWLNYNAGLDGGAVSVGEQDPLTEKAFLALQVVLVWHPVETAGTRTQDVIAAEVSRAESRPRMPKTLAHIIVPGYGWSKGQADAVIGIAQASVSSAVTVRLVLLPPANNAQSVPHGIRRRNDALRRFAGENGNVTVVSWDTAEAAESGRCDGVHYMCVLTPHVALGRPVKLRAPCPHGCNSTAIARYTAAVFDFAPRGP